MDNIYKAVQLTIDSQNLALSKTPTHVYIANQYVDTNDTPLITAPFIIQKALENGAGVVDIVSSTIGSIYEVRLLCDAEVLISGYFYMPPMNVNFSELELYTSYPPRTPPVVNEFWQKTENFILEKTNTLLNFVQVFNAVSSMRLSLGYLEELATTKKSNLVSAINEVLNKTENQFDIVEKAISGINELLGDVKENGWTDLLITTGFGRSLRSKLAESISIEDFKKDDSADYTQAIKDALAYATSGGNSTNLIFTSREHIVSEQIIIPAKGEGRLTLVGLGSASIVASNNFPENVAILKIATNSYNGNNFRINGLSIFGNYKCGGLDIRCAQEWNFHNVNIWNCRVGLSLNDTYYGGITGTSMIRNCLVGVQMGDKAIKSYEGDRGEVNTIDFRNLKLNFSEDKTLFYPKNAGESDVDYNNRVESKAFSLSCILLGDKFDGCTIEGYDYGFYGIDATNAGNQWFNSPSFTSINKCYFEAIKKYAIYFPIFAQNVANMHIIKRISIEDCHFHGVKTLVHLSTAGEYIFKNNNYQGDIEIETGFGNIVLNTDVEKHRIKVLGTPRNARFDVIVNQSSLETASTVAPRYLKNNNTASLDREKTHLNAHEAAISTVIQTPVLVGYQYHLSAINDVKSVTTYPLTFQHTPQGGTQSLNYAGVVLPSPSGKFFMLMVGDDGVVKTKEVKNTARLAPPINSVYATDFYYGYNPANYKDGDTVFVIDINTNAKIANGKLCYVGDTSIKLVYNTSELMSTAISNASWYAIKIWNVDIQYGYNWQEVYWAWGQDWFGNMTNIRAVGTRAQRPETPAIDFMIYLSTDENKYYQWNGSVWADYTP